MCVFVWWGVSSLYTDSLEIVCVSVRYESLTHFYLLLQPEVVCLKVIKIHKKN